MSEPSLLLILSQPILTVACFLSPQISNARGIDPIFDQKDEEKETDRNFLLRSTTSSNITFRITVYL